MRRPFTLWERLKRLVQYRLVIPLKRSQHPPEYTARGVMVGLFWAFTPLIGIQMYLIGLTWAACRWHHRFDFSLITALAWVWVTNVFTMLPIYYVFYVTGEFMMGNVSGATGYEKFAAAWQAALDADGLAGQFYAWAKMVATEQGGPMALGSVPYAVGGAWLGYRWSLKYVRRRRRVRAQRMARKARRRAEAAEASKRAKRAGPAAPPAAERTAERPPDRTRRRTPAKARGATRPALDGGTPGRNS